MGLMDFIRKQFIDIIEWTEADEDTLVWRFPTADMEIQYGASLTVRESQMAVFVNEGQIADVFGPGRYKLSTSTLPVLTYLKNWDKLFQSPFKSEVYFISTRTRVGQKWGTPQAVTVRDKDFGVMQIRAFGQFAWRITDAKHFVSTLSGTRAVFKVADIEQQLRGAIVSGLATALGGSGTPFIDMAANQGQLSLQVKDALSASFKLWGLALEDFQVTSLNLPEAVQTALDTRMRMNIIGDTATYARIQAADALPILAGNEGGGMGALAAQAAMGMTLAQTAMQSLLPSSPIAAPAAAGPASVTTPQTKLAQLKDLLDQGLITAEDYEAHKQAVLKQLLG